MERATGRALRILMVEDNADDALLAVETLRRDGHEPIWRRVESRAELEQALDQESWDLVLSDHDLPGFSGRDALALIQGRPEPMPFILVSGIVGEERAVAYVKNGAADYVLKGNLQRLPLAVGRALEEASAHRRRRQAEAELRTSEARYRALVQSLPDLIFVMDADGTYLDYQGGQASDLFMSPDKFLGRTFREVLPPSVVDVIGPIFEKVVQTRTSHSVEYDLQIGGAVRHFEGRMSPMDNGHVLSIVRDQTRTRQADDRLRDILKHSTNLFYARSPDGSLAYVSPQCRNFLDCEAEDLHATWEELLSDSPANELGRERVAEALRTGVPQPPYELELRTQSGRTLWVDVNEAPVVRDGGVTAIVGSLTDITERKRAQERQGRAEEAVRQAQRLESVGRLAGGIAHDFNNILSVILGISTLAQDGLSVADPLRIDLEDIRRASERAAALTRQLLVFSSRQVTSPTVLDLNAVIVETEKMLTRMLGEHIDLGSRLAPALRPVRADKAQMEQILVNLAVNARDALPDGGHLVIDTADIELAEGAPELAGGLLEPGPYVMLRVSDDGVGMSREILARAFEPFFTTKGVGQGTGLGLATVYGIVQQSRGHIVADSIVGHGTVFTILLPCCSPEASSIEVSTVGTSPAQGAETILLVEDEEAVRVLAQRVLSRFGYRVISAANGQAALLASEMSNRHIDLLLTDVVMPGMGGRELAERLSQLRPGIRVLFMSGYAEELIANQGVLEPGVRLVTKPFLPDALARQVRDALDAPAPVTAD